ncbi:MAG: hypothetical protein OQJ89_04335 [Kangiellaceae bacterium]|nr:hypothetical protein [Kangiellaceae bacterium]
MILRTAILLSIFVCSAGAIQASEVSIPNEFTAGTPARASEVNQNFDAIETAVNDNDVRINANETFILANTNAINHLNETKQYIYPVTPPMVNNAGYPNLRVNSSGMYNQVDLTDIVSAPVVLPHGARVTGMYCLVRDNHDTADFSGGHILLMRVRIEEGQSPGIYEEIVNIDLTTNENIHGLLRLNDEDGLVENAVVDNNSFMYYVRFWIQRTQAVSNLMISGCRLSYEH